MPITWKRPKWFDRAACLDRTDVEFFPAPNNTRQIERAKAICAVCSVRDECLAHALKHEPHGVWGGKSEEERRRIKQTRATQRSRARRKGAA